MIKNIINSAKKIISNKTKRSIISSILAICLLSFVLITCCINEDFAWFSNNRQVKGSDAKFEMYYDDTSAEYEVFKCDPKTTIGYSAIDGVLLSITDIDVDQYDMIFKHRNRYTPVILRAKVIRKESMPKTGTVSFTISRNTSNNDSTLMSDYCSSVMRFSGFVGSQDKTLKDPDAIYKYVDSELFNTVSAYSLNTNVDSSKVFTTATFEGTEIDEITNKEKEIYSYSKTDSITLSFSYNESDWETEIESGIEYEYLYAYIYITYDEGLMLRYTADNNMGITNIDDAITDFENDLRLIRISHTEN